MGKIILLALGVFAAWWILKSYLRKAARDAAPAPAPRAEDMVRCEHCGVHLPRSEGLAVDDRHYCGEEHRRLHEARRP